MIHAENENCCEFCMAAWRLSLVSLSWKEVVFNIGHQLERGHVEWSKGWRIAKRSQRFQQFGNYFSPSMNYYIGGVEPTDPSLICAIREDRLVPPGSEPQGEAREWPNMMDITA